MAAKFAVIFVFIVCCSAVYLRHKDVAGSLKMSCECEYFPVFHCMFIVRSPVRSPVCCRPVVS